MIKKLFEITFMRRDKVFCYMCLVCIYKNLHNENVHIVFSHGDESYWRENLRFFKFHTYHSMSPRHILIYHHFVR